MLDDLLGGLLRSSGRGHADEDPETRKARIGCLMLCAGGLLLIIAIWQGQRDLRLRMWGRPAKAKVERVSRPTSSRGRKLSCLRVVYSFHDSAGKLRSGCDDVGLETRVLPEDEIDVFYLEGSSGYSMIAGQGEWAYFLFGLVGLVLIGVPVMALFKGAFPSKRGGR